MSISQQWALAYEQAFIKDVHQLIAWGYEDARNTITTAMRDADREEESVTGYIVDAIRKRLDAPDTPDKFYFYCAAETCPVNDGQRTGRRRREQDIVIECTVKPRNRFVFEAKRLCANTCPIGDYTGPEGLQCFTNGQYAATSSVAGMVAYVQSHTLDRWSAELGRSLARRSQTLGVRAGLQRITILPSLTHEWTSEHDRVGNVPITIYHLLLDCCPNDAEAAVIEAPEVSQ